VKFKEWKETGIDKVYFNWIKRSDTGNKFENFNYIILIRSGMDRDQNYTYSLRFVNLPELENLYLKIYEKFPTNCPRENIEELKSHVDEFLNRIEGLIVFK